MGLNYFCENEQILVVCCNLTSHCEIRCEHMGSFINKYGMVAPLGSGSLPKLVPQPWDQWIVNQLEVDFFLPRFFTDIDKKAEIIRFKQTTSYFRIYCKCFDYSFIDFSNQIKLLGNTCLGQTWLKRIVVGHQRYQMTATYFLSIANLSFLRE